ncbi:MAG: zinc ribbon domain-containing protein [Oscillospiraceae bacterium]|nr:zinc ribbon domain-containing protein [Oscillospiraceae bacterium]
MKCFGCGRKLPGDNEFCPYCGERLDLNRPGASLRSSGGPVTQAPGAEPDPQEFEKTVSVVDKADKQIKAAAGTVVFIAVINILLGAFLSFFPNVLSGADSMFDSVDGIYYIIAGLMYLGLSFGTNRRSRVCFLIAVGYFVFDAVILLIAGGMSGGAAALFMRIVLIWGLFTGTLNSFKYHSLMKKYKDMPGNETADFIRERKPVMKKRQVVFRVILGCLGIGAAIYGFTGGVYIEGRDFSDWTDYSSGAVTVKMPSSYIGEFSEQYPDMPGVTYRFAQSDSYIGSVFLITYSNMLSYAEVTAEEAGELEDILMSELIIEIDANTSEQSTGAMAGKVRYTQLRIEIQGMPGAIRCFSYGNDVYMAGILLNGKDDLENDYIGRFLESIKVML